MHQFNEHHPELKGFSAFYDAEIMPMLESREADRLSAIAKAKKHSFYIGVIGCLLTAIAIFKNAPPKVFILTMLFPCSFIAVTFSSQLRSVRKFTKAQIVGGICRYVGWQFNIIPRIPNLANWSSLRLIRKGYEPPRSHEGMRVEVEDELSGEVHGADFKSVEVTLSRKVGKSRVNDFKGQLISISFPRQFLGRTIVLRDKGMFQGKKKGNMKRVGLVDPVFEDIFEAYGTDQVEARYLLTPVFMQTLVDLERALGGSNIRFGFYENKLFIAVETFNQFESGAMSKPLTAPARTQKILNEIGAVYNIVDIISSSKRG